MRKDKLKMSNLNFAVDHFNKYGPFKVYPAEKAKILKFPKKKNFENTKSSKIDLSKKWSEFLEKRNLTLDKYNNEAIKKKIEKDKNLFLNKAKSKKELKLLIKAKNIVDQSLNNASKKNPNFRLDKNIKEIYALEIFENLKPEIQKGYIKEKDIHKGDYYSRDVYEMLSEENSWKVASKEYYKMNINDNRDASYFNMEYSNSLNGYKLQDIIKPTKRKFTS